MEPRSRERRKPEPRSVFFVRTDCRRTSVNTRLCFCLSCDRPLKAITMSLGRRFFKHSGSRDLIGGHAGFPSSFSPTLRSHSKTWIAPDGIEIQPRAVSDRSRSATVSGRRRTRRLHATDGTEEKRFQVGQSAEREGKLSTPKRLADGRTHPRVEHSARRQRVKFRRRNP